MRPCTIYYRPPFSKVVVKIQKGFLKKGPGSGAGRDGAPHRPQDEMEADSGSCGDEYATHADAENCLSAARIRARQRWNTHGPNALRAVRAETHFFAWRARATAGRGQESRRIRTLLFAWASSRKKCETRPPASILARGTSARTAGSPFCRRKSTGKDGEG